MKTIIAITFAASFCIRAYASTYYIDFDQGNDANNGTSISNSLKHCPGDPAAEGNAKSAKLEPGDTVIFKGGVVYRGMVNVNSSGTSGKPIVFDGNTEGKFGTGKAIIDGSEPLTGWKRCASAAEAKGNTNWAKIFYLDVPKPREWNSLNLCDSENVLPIAQWPKPADPFYQLETDDYAVAEEAVKINSPITINAGPGTKELKDRPLGTKEIKDRPLPLIISKNHGIGSIVPLRGGCFFIQFPKPVTVAAVGIAIQPKYAAVKEVAFYGDGKELIKATLAKDKEGVQKFQLPAPATLTTLTVQLLEPYEGVTVGFTAIHEVDAYGTDGNNLLDIPSEMSLTDPKAFTQSDPHYYDGMMFAVHGGNNLVFFTPVKGYVPSEHRLIFDGLSVASEKHAVYSLFNSVKLIAQPGEYCVELDPNPNAKTARVFLLPPKLIKDQPVDIGAAKRDSGIAMENASHIVVQGLIIRRQNGPGLSAKKGNHLVFRDCEVTMVRAINAVSPENIDDILIERCYVHHNPGHTRGILLYECNNAITKDCRSIKNTFTALGYFTCSNGQVVGNLVTDNRGQHANGLTFYAGCKNILVENNRVSRGRCALTLSAAEDIIIRNNILDSNMKDMVIGVWAPSTVSKNVQFFNNCIIRATPQGMPGDNFALGFFSNAKKIEGLVFKNNIVDGIASVIPDSDYSNNLFTRNYPKEKLPGKNELYEPDLKKIFVDPDKDDFHLKAGSPAIGAGVDVGLEKDIDGHPRAKGKAPDIGAYAYETKTMSSSNH